MAGPERFEFSRQGARSSVVGNGLAEQGRASQPVDIGAATALPAGDPLAEETGYEFHVAEGAGAKALEVAPVGGAGDAHQFDEDHDAEEQQNQEAEAQQDPLSEAHRNEAGFHDGSIGKDSSSLVSSRSRATPLVLARTQFPVSTTNRTASRNLVFIRVTRPPGPLVALEWAGTQNRGPAGVN